ncbi:MAG: hypothetical protein A2664_02650 [Candidatus Taylorbacteria bacterium RIFCSPHIGHO2_01_FULL_46_22b]|uniref:Cell division protein FtsL n=1 Tax=Candidatus Taylorbacteria bacterium RIFCSPHIGHO2_01_FULL_46_22b TaxID=1802301 RepID=A0A1G2M353_9BACT|nr:MAG: hypothetical protein A2664_02650 [Candidatus Taylorbacteria bacterium RIFCSPHIGHO2_01_FULL_46_22b]
MQEFKLRRRTKAFLYSPLAFFALAFILFFLVRAVWGVYKSQARSSAELEIARKEALFLDERSEFLKDEIDALSSPQGLEEELRSKFPVVKEGEKMVIIVEPDEVATSSLLSSQGGFWKSVKNFFGY